MDYRSVVNPTYFTAQMTSFFLMQAENEDAAKFIRTIGLKNQLTENSAKDKSTPDMFTPEQLKAIMSGSALGIESRYEAVSRILKDGGYKNMLDIACGYTPRSLFCYRNGINYVGFDVPVVADTLSEHAKELLPGIDHSPYVGGDATNKASLLAAADLLDGEIMVSCEGLLGYLSRDEMAQLFDGIRAVLKEHGGAWYTDDFCIDYQELALLALGDKDAMSKYQAMRKKTMTSSNIYNRTSGINTKEGLIAILKENGMIVEELPYVGPGQTYNILKGFSEEIQKNLMAELEKSVVLKITPDPAYNETPAIEGAKEIENLQFTYSVLGSTMKIDASGRIDTISAPVLLESFENNKEGVSSLKIDFSGLEYISSAGLRTLLIMKKALGEDSITIYGVSPAVMDIFETTGFIEFFELL